MTIGKKLYCGFGAILAIMTFLFVINIVSVLRQTATQTAVKETVSDVQTIEGIRYRMIANRLSLGNYLLSGDLRDEEKTNKGVSELQDYLRNAQPQASDPQLRAAIPEVEENEHNWSEEFAKEMIAKRHQVDSGDATVSDLQIFYLQHDPASWLTKSTAILDQAHQSVQKAADESDASAKSASWFNLIITTFGTLLAVAMGIGIAFYTAKTIKEPLYHLIEVAHRIGDTGDLDQTTAGLVFELVERLHATHGLTSILVTHNLDLAARCTRALKLENGHLVSLASAPQMGVPPGSI